MTTDTATSISQRCRAGIREACAQWKQFWFAPEDPFTLVIMRVLTGWMLAYNLLVWGLDLKAFFASDGLQPLASIMKFHEGQNVFSFLFYVPDRWLVPVHWTCFGIAVLFCVGFGTRVTSILAWLITVSYSQRVPVANFGLDQILGLLCLYLAIGPSGAALSVDSWLQRRRDSRRRMLVDDSLQSPFAQSDVSQSDVPVQPIRKLASCRVALRLIQIHICVIYFWAGFAKLKGDSWWTGEAMWQVIANMEYQTMDLTWMAWVPWLPYLIAHITVAWEVFFCVLVWNRTLRPVMLLVGTAMHFGIGAFLGMWTFGLIMTFAYFSFSDPQAWRARFERVFHGRKQFPTAVPPTAVPESRAANSEAPQTNLIPAPVDQPPQFVESISASKLRCLDELESDNELANRALRPETAVLLVCADAEERDTLRQYFRRHDIPCRATGNAASATSLAIGIRPASIVVSGSGMGSNEVRLLLDDLADVSEAPMVAILSGQQVQRLKQFDLPARILNFPVSPRNVRQIISEQLFGSTESGPNNSFNSIDQPPSSTPKNSHGDDTQFNESSSSC